MRVGQMFSFKVCGTTRVHVLTLSLFFAARGSWLRCQFHTAVVSLTKSSRAWPKLASRNADHVWRGDSRVSTRV